MSIPSFTLLVALVVGLSVIWSNPRRRINQAFTLASVWVAFWLFLLWVLNQPHLAHPVPWLKAISAVGACFPCLLWWIGECAVDPDVRWGDFVRRGWRWLLLALVLGGLALSDLFIPAESTPENPLRGPGYPVYVLGLVVSYLLLVVQALLRMRRLTGIQLVEVQTLLVGGALSGLAGLAMTAVPPLLGLPSAAGIAPVAVLFFYALTAWSITNRRIFDARQLFLSVFRRATVLTAATALLYGWLDLATGVVPAGISLLVGLTVVVWLVIWTERRVSGPQFSGQARATERMRAAVLEAGRDEVDPEALLDRYAALLREWGRTDRAVIRPAAELTAGGPGGEPALGEAAAAQLVAERWATPESLSRRRVTPPVEEIEAYLARRQLGLVVVSPRVRGSDPIALSLGRRADGMPYLWPEVRDLLDWTELMEVALARAQLTRRARETEQVATAGLLGANLAHEIRNPLVALKTFAQLLPERHHDPEFRDEFSKLLQKEVGRIESLTEQLLKLSTPRQLVLRPVRVDDIVHECTSLLRPRFAEARICLELDLDASARPVQADSAGLHQVVLNLLVNAIQALADAPGERVVLVRTAQAPDAVVLEVGDNGPGIAPEMRARLFQPFSSGKVNGFGLGLALSANIIRTHRGTIASVDSGRPGALFRITLPCPPS